eukprot:comp12457_c0_seq1/m.7392 comp12457_c0_seq1/g.7392  ORF comp12457_c0_seq1/g.7392 comp12457_c0_seq1/m.7392 type:complete len:319 (-) comp12457_c0_seq1:84-1040(-)
MSGNQDGVFLATAGYDHTIRFWETLTGICYKTLGHPDSQVNKLEITPNRKYIAAAGNPNVRFYDLQSQQPTPELNFSGHTANVTGLGFQSDYKWMYTGSEDGTVKIWDLRVKGCQREYDHRGMVETVDLHPNEVELFSGDQNGRIRLWDLRMNRCNEELIPEPDGAIRSITVARDGSLLVASTNTGNCYVWRLDRPVGSPGSSLTALRQLQAHKGHQVLTCKFSPDSSMLATCSADQTVGIWSTRTLTLDRRLTGHQRWVWDCRWSADSAYLVTASSDRSARLWDVAKGEELRQFQGHQKAVVCLALQDLPPPVSADA